MEDPRFNGFVSVIVLKELNWSLMAQLFEKEIWTFEVSSLQITISLKKKKPTIHINKCKSNMLILILFINNNKFFGFVLVSAFFPLLLRGDRYKPSILFLLIVLFLYYSLSLWLKYRLRSKKWAYRHALSIQRLKPYQLNYWQEK